MNILNCLLITAIVATSVQVNGAPSGTSRIIHGNNSTHVPHNVALICMRSGDFVFGGGSIISNRHVLTSAHLAHDCDTIQIGYGSADIEDIILTNVSDVLIYPLYDVDRADLAYDIAILTVADVDWQAGEDSIAAPIELETNQFVPQIGLWARIVGFGLTEIGGQGPAARLQYSYSVTRPLGVCDRFSIHSHTHYCATGVSEDNIVSNICLGDDGIGAFIVGEERTTLVGVASIVPPDCDPQSGAAFTRVSYFYNWILENISDE